MRRVNEDGDLIAKVIFCFKKCLESTVAIRDLTALGYNKMFEAGDWRGKDKAC